MPQWLTGSDMDAYSLENYQIPDLEKLLEASPWFSIARKELFLKMSAMGEEYRREALRRTVLYLYPDYSVFRQGYVLSSAAMFSEPEPEKEQVYELDFQEIGPAMEETADGYPAEEPKPAGEGRREIYVRVGGDYFMPEELKGVQDQDISVLEIHHDVPREWDGTEFTDENYYTETLARIYADQELYDRANEVYEKLILLYPEKSAYFAALKNDIKKHL